MVNPLEQVQWFLQAGGWVLWGILGLTFLLLTLALERFWYLLREYPLRLRRVVDAWHRRTDRSSSRALCIRQAWSSALGGELNAGIGQLRLLVLLCPLFGLLGTVTGMIQVFDVLAVTGTGNARAMAEGVGRATVPTMAGMLVALVGLYLLNRLERGISKRQQRLIESLVLH